MTDLVIKRGRTYRAKRPRPAGTILEPLVNDRLVRHVDNVLGVVCYDGPAVAIGRHLPRVSIGKFKEWAGRDVTDELPEGKWANWDYRDASKNK